MLSSWAEHQVSHWKAGHKQECPRLAAAASAPAATSGAQMPQQRPAAVAVASNRPPVAAPASEAEVAAAVEAFERFARSLQREAGGEDDESTRAFVIRDEVEGKGRAAFAVRDIAQFRHHTTPHHSLIVPLTRHDTHDTYDTYDTHATRHAQR
jgi:hypothetical protein